MPKFSGCATSQKQMKPINEAQKSEFLKGMDVVEKPELEPEWADFVKDPDWIAARDASEKNGKLLDKAPESTYLKATDFSPAH